MAPGSSLLPGFSAAADPPERLRPIDRQLLGLLGEHQVLTTGQLVLLTGLPERTVQHRLSRLSRAGLLNRHRPQVPLGTAPFHYWLTTFGAAAIGVGPPEPWGEDPAGLRAIAALNELWLGVRYVGPEAGLHLEGWRRSPSGVPWRDLRTGSVRALPVEAELRVTVGGELVSALVLAPVERVPSAWWRSWARSPTPPPRCRTCPLVRCCSSWRAPGTWRTWFARRATRLPARRSPATSTSPLCKQRSGGWRSA